MKSKKRNDPIPPKINRTPFGVKFPFPYIIEVNQRQVSLYI